MSWRSHVKGHPINQNHDAADRVARIVRDMSLEQKLGQMIQAEIASITPEQAREYHIGSILNGGGSFPNGDMYASVDDWRKLADDFFENSVRDGGIPIIWGTDAVHGHSNVFGATIFPHNIGLGASRNYELIRQIGEATAREVSATGIDWTFAPTLAIPQDLRWGRCYEAFSQDPEIVRRCGAAIIQGLQGQDGAIGVVNSENVLATSKHYVGEGGTTEGVDQGDTVCDETTLRELHARGHYAALDAGAQVVMAAFNSWNGERMHAHHYLLTEVLKQELGFQGFVVSDWSGFDTVSGDLAEGIERSVNAGIDMLMVAEDWQRVLATLKALVEQGRIASERIDDAVTRILRVKANIGLLDAAKPSEREPERVSPAIGHKDHVALAEQAVRESLVLLKNQSNLLPLPRNSNVLLLGDGANNIPMQCGGWTLTWQGIGTNNQEFPHGTTLYQGIRAIVEEAGGTVELSDSTEAAEKYDVAIVAFGEEPYAEGEGDLHHLGFRNEHSTALRFLTELHGKSIPTLCVFYTGRPLWVNPELNRSQAFVVAWLPGTQGASMADMLFEAKPGEPQSDFVGRLPFAWPLHADVQPNPYEHDTRVNLFPLGFGLSLKETVSKAMCVLPESDRTTGKTLYRVDRSLPRGTTYST